MRGGAATSSASRTARASSAITAHASIRNPAGARGSRAVRTLCGAMGNVVKLNAPARGAGAAPRRPRWCSAAAASPAACTRSARCGRSTCCPSTASVNQFDIYVGTSAGALIAVAGGQRRHARADDADRSTTRCRTRFRRLDREMLLRPNYREFAIKALKLPLHAARRRARRSARIARLALAPSTSCSRSPTRCRPGSTPARASRTTCASVLSDEGRTDDFRLLAARALPGRDRPRHLRADRARRRGLGRRPDLHRRARLDGAADGLRALPRQGPRAGRRRHRLDHQPRHRGRGGREVHRRRQPARPVRQRLLEADPDAVRHPRAPRLGHGLPEDRLPDVQAARLPAPARDGRATGRSATRASTSS